MPKMATQSGSRDGRRHNPLEQDILNSGPLRVARTVPSKKRGREEENEEHYVDAKASRTILKIGRELMEEDQVRNTTTGSEPSAFEFHELVGRQPESEDDVVAEDHEEWEGLDEAAQDEEHVEPEDLETWNKYFPDDEDDLLKFGFAGKPADAEETEGEGTNLTALILERIAQFEAAQAGNEQFESPEDDEELPQVVIDFYEK
jgi:essential nuclear protein 1